MISTSSSVSPISSEASRAADRASRFACSPQAIGLASLILALSIIQQVVGHQNFDNGWLFTVAERVLEAVLDNELYVFTHPEMRVAVEMRFQAILAAFDKSEASPALKSLGARAVPEVGTLVVKPD